MDSFDVPIDPREPEKAKGAALLYSGGCDSSLAACLLARSFPKVHLNTFDRFGFLATTFPKIHFERMRARFPATEFIHRLTSADGFFKEIESYRYYRSIKEHGLMVLNVCGHCKVALHWRNLLFCLEHGIRYASDGAVTGNEQFAEQNPRILMPELKAFYARFGITLIHPVYQTGLSTEEALYELGITEQRRTKMTKKDMQVVCTQHVLFANFMRVYLSRHGFEEYEQRARTYLKEKIAHAVRLTEEYLNDPKADTTVARLLKKSGGAQPAKRPG